MWLIDRKEFKGNQPGNQNGSQVGKVGLPPLVDYHAFGADGSTTLSAERCRLSA